VSFTLSQSNLFNLGARNLIKSPESCRDFIILSFSLSVSKERELIQYLSCESRAITSWRAGGRLEASAAATPAGTEIAPLNDNATAAMTTFGSGRAHNSFFLARCERRLVD